MGHLLSTLGVPFPRNFKDTVRTIVRRLFRVYAHIYSNHFDQICALGIEGMLNYHHVQEGRVLIEFWPSAPEY